MTTSGGLTGFLTFPACFWLKLGRNEAQKAWISLTPAPRQIRIAPLSGSLAQPVEQRTFNRKNNNLSRRIARIFLRFFEPKSSSRTFTELAVIAGRVSDDTSWCLPISCEFP
jgi:hypothetical protein